MAKRSGRPSKPHAVSARDLVERQSDEFRVFL
jgi:hypothetical protein